ncbi:hypothetical protein COLO4_01639 [Corchorus olitorius]|uniref:Uncharacterized protein n=1 Tax=Corchorus olitorius TaxID=93759 RepID=A0A1R3L275_9ROSI|nr:hypothetical protein COLO4_01639 [Corchorus olitorius]
MPVGADRGRVVEGSDGDIDGFRAQVGGQGQMGATAAAEVTHATGGRVVALRSAGQPLEGRAGHRGPGDQQAAGNLATDRAMAMGDIGQRAFDPVAQGAAMAAAFLVLAHFRWALLRGIQPLASPHHRQNDRRARAPEIRMPGLFNKNNGDSDVLPYRPAPAIPAVTPAPAPNPLIRPFRPVPTHLRLEYPHADLPRLRHGHHLHVPDHDQAPVGLDRADPGTDPVRRVRRFFRQDRPDDARGHQQARAYRCDADVRNPVFRPDDRLRPVRPGRAQDPQAGQGRPAESLGGYRRTGPGGFARR